MEEIALVIWVLHVKLAMDHVQVGTWMLSSAEALNTESCVGANGK